jgi:signal transduction histidine kinase
MDRLSSSMASPPSRVKARWGLKGKLLLSMLVVGVVPLLFGLILPFFQGIREIQEVSGSSFVGLATETARKLDLVLSEEIARTARIATDMRVIEALEDRRDAVQDLPAEVIKERVAQNQSAWLAKTPQTIDGVTQGPLGRLLRQYYTGVDQDAGHPVSGVTRSATRALFLTDIEGTLVASITPEVAYQHKQEAWWQGAYKRGVGQPHLSDLYFDEGLGTYALALSLPIMDRIRYQAIGVLHRVYDAKEFLDPSVYPVKFGKTGHAMVIDSAGTVLSCPILPTGTRLADPTLIPLVTPPQPGWVRAPSDGHGGQQTSIIGFATLPATSRTTQTSTGRMWHTFVWQSSQELFAPIKHLFMWVTAFGLIAVGLLLTLGYVAASRIVTPIRKLQRAAKLIGRGELAEPITIKTGDEIEELGDEISRMNAQLQAAFAGLTDQIELKTKEAQYVRESTDQILDSVPNPIVLLDPQEHIEYLNKASRLALHLRNGDPIGANLFDLIEIDAATRARLRADFTAYSDTLGHGGPRPPTTDPELAVRDPLAPIPAFSMTDARKEIRIGDRTYQYEWFQVSALAGQQPRIGYVLRDTTDESRLQDHLIQAEKSGSLGVLTAGIGHELNNPLCGIFGLGEAIQDEKDVNTIKAQVQDMIRHGKRMASIIQDFTGLAQVEAKGQSQPVDLNEQIEQAMKLVLQAHDPRPEVQTSLDPLPKVKAKPEDIRQAFIQIIRNAVQAMQGKGTLSISTQMVHGSVQVVIQDTGPGIPRPYLMKVFDPFFTTKQQGEGSGLGLTIVRRIVTKYGGQIRIDSEEGRGTICVLTFPVREARVEQESPA